MESFGCCMVVSELLLTEVDEGQGAAFEEKVGGIADGGVGVVGDVGVEMFVYEASDFCTASQLPSTTPELLLINIEDALDCRER